MDPYDSVKSKTVLVTGGTGSFGTMMTNTLLQTGVKKIKLMSRHEDLQVQKKRLITDSRVEFILGDVRDYERCLEASRNVDIIFHAAALKHIDEIEGHPIEAVKTNVLGSWNIKRAAIINNVDKVVCVSTDKAVKPINVYGMTKGIDERVFLSTEIESQCKFSVIRYGNVLGSRGSVIQYWYELAKKGETLPITDERMTRFWITLKEAMDLVFFSLREPGKLVVRKCKSFAIKDLADMYVKRYGVKTKVIGLRLGEKINETLLSDYEMRKAISAGDFYVVDLNGKNLNRDAVDFTSDTAQKISYAEMENILKKEGFL